MSHVDPSKSSSTSPPLSLLGRSALAYVERFGWAVHPLKPGAKTPITPHGFKDASTDPEQIRSWWTKTPDANIGIATGATSGLSVLDVDVKDNAGGDATLAALLAEHGDSFDAQVHQQTWSGGQQVFFAYDPRARQGAGCYGKALDGRNDGGYVVAPPSIVNGSIYTWVVKPNGPLLPMPAWLLDLGAAVAPTSSDRRNPPGWAAELMLKGVGKGERDHEANRLIKHARETGKSEADCWARLTTFGSNCTPPFDPKTDRKIAEKIRKAYAQPLAFEGPAPKPIIGSQQAPSVEPAVAEVKPWTVYDVADIDDKAIWLFPPTEWIVEGLIPARGVMWTGGLPKSNKSLFSLYTFLATASGRDLVAERFKILKRPKVLYLAKEDPGQRFQDRILDIRSTPGWSTAERDRFHLIIQEMVNFADEDAMARLTDLCLKHGYTVVVPDTWTALSPGADPANPDHQNAIAQRVVKLAQDIRGLVDVIDHSRKNKPEGSVLSAADIFGPSQKWQAAEHVVMFGGRPGSPDGEMFVEGKDVDASRFKLVRSPRGSHIEKYRFAGDVDAMAQGSAEAKVGRQEQAWRLVEAGHGPQGAQTIADKLGVSKDTATRYLKAGEKAGRLRVVPAKSVSGQPMDAWEPVEGEEGSF